MAGHRATYDIDALIEELTAKRRRLDADIATLEATQRVFDVYRAQEQLAFPQLTDCASAPTFAETVGNAIEEVLLAERPLHRKEILARVEAKGLHIEAEKRLHYFGTFLTNGERFITESKATGLPGVRGYWTLAHDPDK